MGIGTSSASVALILALLPRPGQRAGEFVKDNLGKMIRKVGLPREHQLRDPVDTDTRHATAATACPSASRRASTNGWRYPFGIAWFTEEFDSPTGHKFRASCSARPVVGGIGYGWHFGKLSTGVADAGRLVLQQR